MESLLHPYRTVRRRLREGNPFAYAFVYLGLPFMVGLVLYRAIAFITG